MLHAVIDWKPAAGERRLSHHIFQGSASPLFEALAAMRPSISFWLDNASGQSQSFAHCPYAAGQAPAIIFPGWPVFAGHLVAAHALHYAP